MTRHAQIRIEPEDFETVKKLIRLAEDDEDDMSVLVTGKQVAMDQ